MSIRVMLVDDHKILRDALKGILEREHDIVLVGEASNGLQALERARELLPDVVLMDIGLPAMGGIEVTRALLAELPKTKVVALSTFSDRRVVTEMLDAGASGYVVKSSGRDELLRAIRAVANGRTYLCPDASVVLIESVRSKPTRESLRSEPLGQREREVLQLLADGHTSPEIGELLHIATSTVEVHRRNIMRKLELHSVAELTKYAIRVGLTSG
ncbi:MAG: response regulator transcription factor [Propionivibrio sp.]